MSSPSEVLAPRVTAAIAAAFGAEYPELRDADPVLRPSQFADFQANARAGAGQEGRDAAAGGRGADRGRTSTSTGSREPVEISGPGFLNLTLTNDWLAGRSRRSAADPRLGVPRQPTAEHPDRLLRAQRGQGDARRAPAHHRRRRRAGPHAGAPRAPRDPAEPHRRLGHAVRHAHRAPARRRRGLRRGRPARDRPERLLPGGPRGVRRATRPSPTRARRRVVALQAGDPDTLRLWSELVDLSKLYFNRIYDASASR